MNTKKEAFIWILYGGLLILLFLLSSTNLLIKERVQEVYPISVIIEDARDDDYGNFKKGMDQAAIELNADVSFITLYESGNMEQQKDFLVREQQDGARALIISPVDSQGISEMLVGNRLNGPIVLYKSNIKENSINATLSPDYFVMGQMIGEKAIANQPGDQPVYLFGTEILDEVSQVLYNSIRTFLGEHGYQTILIQNKSPETFRDTLDSRIFSGGQQRLLIALDPVSLSAVAELLEGSDAYATYVDGLYGRGSTIPILNYLDKGIITGICVTDEFAAGYLSVKKAVDAIQTPGLQETIILDSYYIEKEDIRKPEYEKMLYPIG